MTSSDLAKFSTKKTLRGLSATAELLVFYSSLSQHLFLLCLFFYVIRYNNYCLFMLYHRLRWSKLYASRPSTFARCSFFPSRWPDDAPYKSVKPNDRYRVCMFQHSAVHEHRRVIGHGHTAAKRRSRRAGRQMFVYPLPGHYTCKWEGWSKSFELWISSVVFLGKMLQAFAADSY